MNRSTKAVVSLVILCATLGALYLGSQRASGQAPPLKAFFETVVRNPSTLPKFEDLHSLTQNIANMRPEDIRSALPAVFEALVYQDENVKAYACAALFAVAGRPDGAKLLTDRVDAIGHDLLSSPFERVQGGEVIILGRLTPTPPEAVHILLTFVKQADRDPNARGGAIFELLRIAPEDPELVTTIREFLSGPIDSNVRIGVMNALGNPRTKDFQLIALVTESFRDPNPSVKLTAIQALMRMGKEALQQAETELSRLAADPGQPAEVQENAKQALHQSLLPTD